MRTRQHSRTVALLGTILVTTGACANLAVTDKFAKDYAHHYIIVHRDGHALSARPREGQAVTGNRTLTDPGYAAYLGGIVTNIDHRAREQMQEQSRPCAGAAEHQVRVTRAPLRLLLFVHGGLNGYSTEYQRMKVLFSPNRGFFDVPKTGETAGPPAARSLHYPLFINWNSSLGDSIADDIFFIRNGRRGDWWESVPFAPFVLLSRVAQSVFGAPVSWGRSIDNYNDGITELSFTEQLEDRSLSVPLLPVRALATPVVEAFGTPAWHIMKRRAQLAVASRLPRAEADGDDTSREGAARLLMLKLRDRVKRCGTETTWETAQGARVPVEITLVGHSMGAIVLNRLLGVAGASMPIRRIVYMAPASGVDELEAFIVPYMHLHPDTHFWWFSLSPFHEVREDYIVPPRGTLLSWIDSFFEPARTAGQSTFGRARNLLGYYRPNDLREEPGTSIFGTPHVATEASPLPKDRVVLYVMDRKRDDLPRRHGDFTRPRIFGEVLCEIDRGAFTDGFCGTNGRVRRLDPR